VGDRSKILIVDDDPDIVEAMRVVLESKKYEVAVAGSGEAGLALARSERPDLIILDVMMETGSKGFEVSRKLNADEDLRKIPILMLTAIKEKTGIGFSHEAGDDAWLPVDEYLEKPLKPEVLLAKVETLLK
jgi:CheY-like chemotaxis protein